MNEPTRPEERAELPEHAETPTERVKELATDLRLRAEELGATVQERAKELGDTVGERTRELTETVSERTNEAVGQIRYFSEQAREEAAARLDEAGRFLNRQTAELEEDARETIRKHPGTAVLLASIAGFLLALGVRRLAEAWRRGERHG